ncbi:MAG: phosphotransferase [Rhodobacter sp.]|nr:phosphotransferase [Rhodobacter sp.]
MTAAPHTPPHAELTQLAQRAVAQWGGSDRPLRLLSHRENAVFDAALPAGRAALRLHRPGYRSDSQILAELDWTRELAAAGFPAPQPMPMSDGGWLLHLGQGQRATCIGWLDGVPIGEGTDRLTHDSVTEYARIGEMLARLHTMTIAMGAERLDRPRWDIDGLTGAQPLWGQYWGMPLLTPSQRDMVIRARDVARARLRLYQAGGAEITLIHSDALRENVFRLDDRLGLIDFDDSGFGFVMYELAASVTQLVDDPLYPEIQAAIVDGYASLRPLRAVDREAFDMFAMLRAFSALGWTIPRLPADHPRLPTYVRRAMSLTQRFLDE